MNFVHYVLILIDKLNSSITVQFSYEWWDCHMFRSDHV